jgi:RHS repeat-associated protein
LDSIGLIGLARRAARAKSLSVFTRRVAGRWYEACLGDRQILFPESAVVRYRLAVLPSLTVVATMVLTAFLVPFHRAAAQVRPLCQTGCGGDIADVYVTPDGLAQNAITGHATTVAFVVHNSGNVTDTYTLTCSIIGGNETCGNVSPSSMTLAAARDSTVNLTFTPGAAGTSGTVRLRALGSYCNTGGGGGPTDDILACTYASDTGSYNITNVWPWPSVSVAPMNLGGRGVDPFDAVLPVTTPAYQSLGAARAVTLLYNSSTARPTPAVTVDVTNPYTPYPSQYSVQVALAASGARLHLLNGADSVFYVAGTSDTSRLVAALDAQTNGLGTGWYDVNVTVTSYYTGGINSTTVPARIFVDDESQSPIGAGWQIAGIEHLYTMTGSYSALITNGDGSMSYFRRDCSNCAFISPAGDPSRLTVVGTTYRRATADSSAVLFASDGHMTGVWSGALNAQTVTLNWSGTQLTSIQDYVGKRFVLGYQSGKLHTITDPAGRVTTPWVDGSNKLYKVTDPDNLFTSLAYDGSFRLTAITDRAGNTTNLTYDALSFLDSTKAPSITTYTGSVVRPTTTVRAPERLTWQPTVSGATSATAKAHVRSDTVYGRFVDPVGSVTQVAYNRFRAATRVIDPLGQSTWIARDTLGQPTYVTEPNGHTTVRTYSGYYLTGTYDYTTGRTVNYTYNTSLGTLLTVSGNTTRTDIYYYPSHSGGPLNGPVQRVYVGNTSGSYAAPSGGFVADTFVYGAWGVDSLARDGAGHTTKYFYSDTAHFRNVVQTIDAAGRTVSTVHYDAAGRPDTVWTPSNTALAKRVLSYDSLNRVTAVQDPLGYTTHYAYGPVTLTRVTDAKGQVYRFDHNALGWVTAQHDLGDTTKADTLKYDAAGRVRTVRTRRGDVISMTYDAVGRRLIRSGPDFPPDTFRFDPAGRWVVGLNANAYDSLAYDPAGRLTSSLERLTGDSSYVMTYTYDSLSRLQTRSAPRLGNPVRYAYNSTGALDSLCTAGQCTAWLSRDADNLPRWVEFGATTPHPWIQVLARDSLHRLVSDSFIPDQVGYSVAPLDTAFAKRFYYDTLGRLTDEWAYGSTYGYGGYRYRYDAAGRLLSACNDQTTYVYPLGVEFSCIDEYGEEADPLVSSAPQAYRYDAAGNRTDSLQNAVIGAGNRVTQFKGYAVAYDLNGDIISKKGADTTLFTWDASGGLKQTEFWTPGGAHTVVTFGYDALGRRVAKTVNGVTTHFVHDGAQVVEDIDAAHNLKVEYGWGPGTDHLMYVRTPATTSVAIPDPIVGSIRGLATADLGTTLKQYAAPFWGQVAADTGFIMRYRLAGREYDQEARIYYNRARYYDPQLGRFLSEDPIGIAGGLNLYAYAGNDPINGSDPTGFDCTDKPGDPCQLPGVGVSVWADPSCVDYGGGAVAANRVECRLEADQCEASGGSWSWSVASCTVWEDVGNGPGSVGEEGLGVGDAPPRHQLSSSTKLCLGHLGKAVLGFVLDASGISAIEGLKALGNAARVEGLSALNAWRAGTQLELGNLAEVRRLTEIQLVQQEQAAAYSGQAIGSFTVAEGTAAAGLDEEEPWWLKVAKLIPILGTGIELGQAFQYCGDAVLGN